MSGKLKIGILGCSYVSTYAIIEPARQGADIVVTAIASRDAARAAEFAAQHCIPQSFGSYEDMLFDGDFEAVYIGLPNSMHGRWAKEAMALGYPVLCEKPMAANAAEADHMTRTSEATGVPLVEAIHWQTHPIAPRIKAILAGLGPLQSMDMRFSLPGDFLPRDNIRFAADLAGGWLMDQGCYCISMARFVAGEPEAVVSATASEATPGVDGGMEFELAFPGGVHCRIGGSMIDMGVTEVVVSTAFACAAGTLTVTNPFLPGANPFTVEQGALMVVERADGTREEERADLVSSWFCQANAFAKLVREWNGGPVPAWDAVANMKVVDAVYRAAGMEARTPAE